VARHQAFGEFDQEAGPALRKRVLDRFTDAEVWLARAQELDPSMTEGGFYKDVDELRRSVFVGHVQAMRVWTQEMWNDGDWEAIRAQVSAWERVVDDAGPSLGDDGRPERARLLYWRGAVCQHQALGASADRARTLRDEAIGHFDEAERLDPGMLEDPWYKDLPQLRDAARQGAAPSAMLDSGNLDDLIELLRRQVDES
jgi:hypothetical protein